MSLPRGIEGNARTVLEVLSNKTYKLDFYQREYKWEKPNITDLLDDLSSQFIADYDQGHEREAVKGYSNYFLGPIVVCQKRDASYIVDGQQRLTSLTLLMIYLNHLLKDDRIDSPTQLLSCLFSESFGKKSFNLDVDERAKCIDSLYNDEPFDTTDQSESIQNLYNRYQDIRENFPEIIDNDNLLHFIDWLLHKVEMVGITAFNDEDAYTIFETMNDRGLSLNPTDMLKSYLLANMNPDVRMRANNLWRNQIGELIKIDKAEETNFFKVWLRAKYANSIRERRRGAQNRDFENINSYHRWVRTEQRRLELFKKNNFQEFGNG